MDEVEITNEDLEVEYYEFTKEDFEGDTYTPDELEGLVR